MNDLQAEEKISIIIPTRNRKDLAEQSIQSCLKQSYNNIEVIVNDNSDISTEELSLSHPKLSIHKTNGNLSMSENWCDVMNRAKGDYILRLDDDNRLLKDTISKMVKCIKEKKLDVISFLSITVNQHKNNSIHFTPNEQEYILSAEELIDLEVATLIDSNYTIYKRSILNIIKSSCNPIYQNLLPDRNLAFHIANEIKKGAIKYCYKMSIGGISRLDYRRILPDDYRFSFNVRTHRVLINQISKGLIDRKDCRVAFPEQVILNMINFIKLKKESFCGRYLVDKYIFNHQISIQLLLAKLTEKRQVSFKFIELFALLKLNLYLIFTITKAKGNTILRMNKYKLIYIIGKSFIGDLISYRKKINSLKPTTEEYLNILCNKAQFNKLDSHTKINSKIRLFINK